MAGSWGLFVLLAGCGIFSPDEGKPPDDGGPAEYPILSHPSQVLTALEMAYSRLDSIKVKELYDYDYKGSSNDLNDPGGTIDVTHADEVRHVQALGKVPGLSANLDLGSDPVWDRLSSDDPTHPEWAVIQIQGALDYQVTIYEPGKDPLGAVGEAGTFQEFAFTPTLDSNSPSDTLWKIIRWIETGNSEPDPPTP